MRKPKFDRRYKLYIAGPITKGDFMRNIRCGVAAAHWAQDIGFAPYCPHLSAFAHFAEAREYEDWMDLDFQWLHACDALLRLPGESAGADREVKFARAHGIPVFEDRGKLYDHFDMISRRRGRGKKK